MAAAWFYTVSLCNWVGPFNVCRIRKRRINTHAHNHIKSNKMCVNNSILEIGFSIWTIRMSTKQTKEMRSYTAAAAAPVTITTVVAEVSQSCFVVGVMFANQECHSFLFHYITLHTHFLVGPWNLCRKQRFKNVTWLNISQIKINEIVCVVVVVVVVFVFIKSVQNSINKA